MPMPRCWMNRSDAQQRGQGCAATPPRRPATNSCYQPPAAYGASTINPDPPPPLAGGGRGEGALPIGSSNWHRPLPPTPSRKGTGSSYTLDADAIVCSALLDLVSASWLEHLLNSLTIPFLACLTVDGRDAWHPHHPSDAAVRAAFRRDQHRDKGFGRALGPTAPSFALRALAERGFVTASAPSDWRIPRTALRMQRALIEGRGAADPHWQAVRLRQAMRGRLAITIGHRDILAFPPGG